MTIALPSIMHKPTIVQTITLTLTLKVTDQKMPDNDRAEWLWSLYGEHVKPITPGDDWKSACYAEVEPALVADVWEAMNFHGSLVNNYWTLADGRIRLESLGYRANGF
jgi:hypothetical protein